MRRRIATTSVLPAPPGPHNKIRHGFSLPGSGCISPTVLVAPRSASTRLCILAATTAKKSSCSAFNVTGFFSRLARSSIKSRAKAAGNSCRPSTNRASRGSSACFVQRFLAGPTRTSSASGFDPVSLYRNFSSIARTLSSRFKFGWNVVYTVASAITFDGFS